MIARTEIKNDTMVQVFNDAYGIVGYSTDKVSRDFPKDSKKQVTVAELEDVMNSEGGKQLFLKNRLLIKDVKIREYFDLPDLGEYNLTKEQVKELLKKEDLSKLEEVLQYCSNDVLDKIVKEAIETRISSVPQAGLIKSYSGVDIIDAIEDSEPAKKPTSTDAPRQAQGESSRKYARKKTSE